MVHHRCKLAVVVLLVLVINTKFVDIGVRIAVMQKLRTFYECTKSNKSGNWYKNVNRLCDFWCL